MRKGELTGDWREFADRLNKYFFSRVGKIIDVLDDVPRGYTIEDYQAEFHQELNSWLSGIYSHSRNEQSEVTDAWQNRHKKQLCPIYASDFYDLSIIQSKIAEDPAWLFDPCVAGAIFRARQLNDRAFFQALAAGLKQYSLSCPDIRSTHPVVRNFLFELFGSNLRPSDEDGGVGAAYLLLRTIATEPEPLKNILEGNLLSSEEEFADAVKRWSQV